MREANDNSGSHRLVRRKVLESTSIGPNELQSTRELQHFRDFLPFVPLLGDDDTCVPLRCYFFTLFPWGLLVKPIQARDSRQHSEVLTPAISCSTTVRARMAGAHLRSSLLCGAERGVLLSLLVSTSQT